MLTTFPSEQKVVLLIISSHCCSYQNFCTSKKSSLKV